jgi:hypothetical protein
MSKHEHKSERLLEVCECGATRPHGTEKPWEPRNARTAGAELVGHYLARATPEDLAERSTKAAQARWKTAKQRSKHMSFMAKHPRPGRVVQDRCPCGLYSKAYAAKRGHKCEPPHKGEPHGRS